MATYIGTVINQSPTITLVAREDITKAQGKAVMVVDGEVAAATAGANAIGIIPMSEDEEIKKGSDVTIIIKDIGAWVVGDEVNVGDELTSDANGCAVKASSGDFITGIAMTPATSAGTIIRAQIVKAGYK